MNSAVVVLDFEGIAPGPHSGYGIGIQGFYNGGESSVGTSGANYGVSFSSGAGVLCLNTTNITCSNTSRGGEGNPGSALGALEWQPESSSYVNLPTGFDSGVGFYYAAAYQPGGHIEVHDGLDGTGNVLARLDLAMTTGSCPAYSAAFCPLVATGVDFAGTARSVLFVIPAYQVVFDDLTLGASAPPVPLPATIWLLGTGIGAIGWMRRKRSARQVSWVMALVAALPFSTVARAAPVAWTLQDVALSDGQSLTGSFTFDYSTGVFSDIAVLSSGAGAYPAALWNTAFSFSGPRPRQGAVLIWLMAGPATGTNTVLGLYWNQFGQSQSLTDAGGVVTLRTPGLPTEPSYSAFMTCGTLVDRRVELPEVTELPTCANADALQGRGAPYVVSGTLATVPAPAAGWLLGTAVAGLLGCGRRAWAIAK